MKQANYTATMPKITNDIILGQTIACSFILAGQYPPSPQNPPAVPNTLVTDFLRTGNAITQSFMSVPAVLVDFPDPASPSLPLAARKLARQWRVFYDMGNIFFRPINMLGIAGYTYTSSIVRRREGMLPGSGTCWKVYALAAACHMVTVVHSAVNMQGLNKRILKMKNGADVELAEHDVRKWGRLNLVRLVMPLLAGLIALQARFRDR
jgi:hypothetical protein